MSHENPGAGTRVAATDTTFDVLERLRETEGGGVSELADALDVSKSTVHNHLQTLARRGYVVREDDAYRLGLRFLQLGDRARQRHGLFHAATDEVDTLVEEVGERAQVMVEEDGVGIYIYQSLADRAVQTDSHIGTVVDLHATAVGKAYLGHLPAERREATLDAVDFRPVTPNTVTDRAALEAELEEVAARGYAFNDEERIVGMRAVGAPILSDDDRVLGGVSVSGPTTRLSGSWYREEVPEMVSQSARVVGIRATYS
jgi:DNA-binding IclR family transcriptional regulator